ncbi:MAG TPA: mechanosensitive ion channel domain-containing protein [Holophagaceae bacterium]|nr:mechanosensitive ion channel domain-containing protein [Holophagaceae bacterium]
MKFRQWLLLGILTTLVALASLGFAWTRDLGPAPDDGQPAKRHLLARKTGPVKTSLVDQHPLQEAQALAALATGRQEIAFAQDAVRLADHQVDLAYADALRQAAESAPPASPRLKELQAAKAKAADVVDADQQLIARLTKESAAARGDLQDSLEDQLTVAKAQQELDQDELDEAAEDLERAGGDPQAKIKRLMAAHDAAEAANKAAQSAPPAPQDAPAAGGLIPQMNAWMALGRKLALLDRAQQHAQAKAARLTARRGDLAKQVAAEAGGREATKQAAASFARNKGTAAQAASKDAAKSTLADLKHYMSDQRLLADMGKRIEDEQDLSETYGNWTTFAEGQKIAVLHGILGRLLWILAVMLGVALVNRLIEHAFRSKDPDKRHAGSMRMVARFGMQVLGLVVIIFIALGMPTQTTTVLGLAGAGLTVAMKDFIVAFFGWFVLMGRNGVRVGDWVEIKGVGGEVVEIGLLRTVLLETGSWSDAGHPTGRRVAFSNSFAIEGHFFNFSTSGQWMWDEISVQVPNGQDLYPVLDSIQKRVEEETRANAGEAEEEWRRSTSSYRVQAFSATPGIQVVPAATGTEIHIRYITRAFQRHDTRKTLYQAVIELMHGKREEPPAATS